MNHGTRTRKQLTAFKPGLLSFSIQAALMSGLSLVSVASMAQSTEEPATQLDRVVVTGSNIRKISGESASPVQVLTSEDLKKSGYTDVSDVLRTITANNSGTLSQSFSQAFASGASGVALRGLTVGATLVLIDGHRMAPYPLGDDGQRQFVDISSIPFDAIERIEVLKDGASAVYGSDAMAGVVNVILKKSFNGYQASVEYGRSSKGDGTEVHASATAGWGDLGADKQNGYISVEYRKQDPIYFYQRPGLLTQRDYSSYGGVNTTPGVPNANNGGLASSITGYLVDPNGGSGPSAFFPGCNAASYAAGGCSYQNTWSEVQPKTENKNLVARYTANLGDDWQLSLQGSYFESTAEQVSGFGSTFPGGYSGVAFGPGQPPAALAPLSGTTISPSNPSFPAGTGITTPQQLFYNFANLGPTRTLTDAKSSRLIADLEGRLGGWDINASVGFTQVKLNLGFANYINPANLQNALDNTGGAPGYYLVGGNNSAAMNNYIAPYMTVDDSSKLYFAHIAGTRELMNLEGGPLALSIGADQMHRSLDATAPLNIANGTVPGNNAFAVGVQNVSSVFAEMSAPVTKRLELEAAARYDHYNISGGALSPKVGFKFTANPMFAIRGTLSEGFRAPGPAENGQAGQSFLLGSAADPLLCPNPNNATANGNYPNYCNSFQPVHANTANPNLKAENSKSATLGILLQPAKWLSANIDLYSVEIDNQIVPTYDTDWNTAVRSNPAGLTSPCYQNGVLNSACPYPIATQTGQGAIAGQPIGPLAYVTNTYVNANSTKTSGVDFDIELRYKLGTVDWKSNLQITKMFSYIQTIGGTAYQLAGTHGPSGVSGDTGTPDTRVQWANTFKLGAAQITGTINYISSFSILDPSIGQSTCGNALFNGAAGSFFSTVLDGTVVPAPTTCRVGSFTTFDLSGSYEWDKHLSFHGSVLNLFNTGFPADWSTYGGAGMPFNPSMHTQGAIGRYFNVGASYRF